jgi:cytidylate kinase
MCIIAVSEEAFSGGQQFAKTLADRLGLRYVDSTILVERAAAWGGDREKLRAALEDAPTFLDRFTRRRQIQILQLQAALAEDIRDGNAVCYGFAADLLSLTTRQILRICLHASHRSRRLEVQEHLKLEGAEAERYLNECDRTRRRWLLYLFGAKADFPLGFDLVINLGQASLDAAYTTVFEMLLDRNRFSAPDPALERFALSARIRGAFAQDPDTAHLDLDVEIHGDTATLLGTVRSVEEIDSIERVPLPIPTGMKVDCSQVQLGSWDYVPTVLSRRSVKPDLTKKPRPWSPVLFRPAWALAGVAVMLLLVAGGSSVRGRWFHPHSTHLLNIAGVITDSQCGIAHKVVQQTAECVRSCVKAPGAKYVLNDGTRNFVLTDQQAAERLAAQRVVATGYLDEITGELQLRSLHAVAR